ncbi:uncharacterized protein C8orf74 homolog [Latimeria chalumnae]|uniref:Chromosome 8 open reading frame 74 n=1 Tax=Latimeria chalumnae TaxID=7897 RepID=H3AEZ3_LATCH|nr:PREDICTED: uncharacterized protein C8orf74 homolog [Latimeria chalumnae]|eukprot:XP_014348178.1 PREDICTED: uncharacterized protein C8orf74 homolog [Latimeria chalumnae]
MASLTTEDVFEVARLQKEDGREQLRRKLKWEEFDEDKDLLRGIFLDFVYDAVLFAARKGFPWPAVAEVGELSAELLTKTKGKTVAQTIAFLKGKLGHCRSKLQDSQWLILFEYFYNTFISHHRLYQFVLCRKRELVQSMNELEIHVPPEPLPLKEATEFGLWDYQQRMLELEAAERQKRTNMLFFRETLHLEGEQKFQKLFEDLQVHDTEVLDREMLEKVVKEALQIHLEMAAEILQEEVVTTFEILQLKLQKKILKCPGVHPLLASSGVSSKSEKSKSASKSSKSQQSKGKRK